MFSFDFSLFSHTKNSPQSLQPLIDFSLYFFSILQFILCPSMLWYIIAGHSMILINDIG